MLYYGSFFIFFITSESNAGCVLSVHFITMQIAIRGSGREMGFPLLVKVFNFGTLSIIDDYCCAMCKTNSLVNEQ